LLLLLLTANVHVRVKGLVHRFAAVAVDTLVAILERGRVVESLQQVNIEE
jgi:hypothetical protein